MMKKGFIVSFALTLMFTFLLSGCSQSIRVNTKNPVTLTLWHNYGGQMKETMDQMIDEFNDSVGKDNGIIISVTSISGSATLHDKLIMAANNDPGAPILPDITTAYPKTALQLADKELLVNLDDFFSAEELSHYIPQFLQEGRIVDGGLYVFPTAKSTEVLFVNSTIFNRFAMDTGASIEDLKTFEGIAKTADLYYKWTDSQTPDIENDGKAFYMPDSLSNFSMIAFAQLKDEFINNEDINLTSNLFPKIWSSYFEPAATGRFAIFNGYATDLAKTGDIVCSTGSTAGVLFFSPTVTYADNTTESAELVILPYPVFEDGNKVAIQRGAGMSVIKSTKEKEYAAGVFLKWFTRPDNNLRFVSSTGYLPVTVEAFGDIMNEEIANIQNSNIKNLLSVSKEMQKEYDFFIPPIFDGVDELFKEYESVLKKTAQDAKDKYTGLLSTEDETTALAIATDGKYEAFIEGLSEE